MDTKSTTFSISAAQLRALVPVSDGTAMHHLATRPQLYLKMQHDPVGALRDARRQVRDHNLASPVPADRWMQAIYAEIEAALGARLTDFQRRKLCARALGDAIAHGHDIWVVIDEARIVLSVGRRAVVGVPR